MTQTHHPHKHLGCPNCHCGPDAWETERKLPQIGQTYVCSGCGAEMYAYDNSDHGKGQSRRWEPVTQGMLINLQFWSVCEAWPDANTDDLVKRGLERMEAIDYHIVEREGLSQTDWAGKTDRDQSTVSENVAKAKDKLGGV